MILYIPRYTHTQKIIEYITQHTMGDSHRKNTVLSVTKIKMAISPKVVSYVLVILLYVLLIFFITKLLL